MKDVAASPPGPPGESVPGATNPVVLALPGPKVNILVVDDRPDKLLIYQTVLAELGENVVTAASGEEALKWMLRLEFAVILLDVNMPTMDGFETAALIRRRRTLAHTPIIFVTAYNDDMHSKRGYALGAVDYILTPFIPEVLRTKVGVFVQLFRMSQQVKQQADDRVQLAREQAARVAAEASIRRSAFLADASRILSSSLDFAATSKRLVECVVPYLADFCGLAVADETGRVQHLVAAWAPPQGERRDFTAGVGARLLEGSLAEALTRAMTTGQPESIALLPRCSRLEVGCGEVAETRALDLGCELHQALLFPLIARDRTLGVLLLAFCALREPEPPEHALATELVGRIAIALDNALLYSKIRQADKRKDEFLAMLAHELRNPLAPIRNAVEILRMLEAPTPTHEQLRELIAKEVGHLSHLVDDLLDVSRITQGKIVLRSTDVDLRDVLASAAESTRTLREARGHRLEFSPGAEPLRMRGDPVRLAQVVVNLLDNAAKFTAAGGTIAMTAERSGAECILRIRDTGIGIAPELLPVVFDLFTQGDRSLDRAQGGLGIGLALVKDLVHMHGGTVEAASAGPGRGSEFVVRLPLAEHAAEPAEPAQPAAVASAPPPSSRRILVVDDQEDSTATLALLFEMHGHEVATAQSGPDALQLAPQFLPDVVVLDIGLPGMDGYEVARRLRELPHGQHATLIALSGYGQPEDQRRSSAAGFHTHLVKPVEPSKLLALVASLATAAPQSAG